MSDLAARVAARASLTHSDAGRAFHAVFETIADALATGGMVTLAGFGRFSTRPRPKRRARNPRTGEPIDVPASTVAAFKPGRTLRDAVDRRTHVRAVAPSVADARPHDAAGDEESGPGQSLCSPHGSANDSDRPGSRRKSKTITPSHARRRILILRIAATVLYLYAIPTFIISALRMLYEKSRNIELARLFNRLDRSALRQCLPRFEESADPDPSRPDRMLANRETPARRLGTSNAQFGPEKLVENVGWSVGVPMFTGQNPT